MKTTVLGKGKQPPFRVSVVSSFVSHEESKEFPNPDGTPGSRLQAT